MIVVFLCQTDYLIIVISPLLFQFNDLLLVCEQGINLIRPSYSVRDKLSIDGMKVCRRQSYCIFLLKAIL
jgi:hypothetical protein